MSDPLSDPPEPPAEVPPAPEAPVNLEPAEAPIVTIGDIVVSQHWVVTPNGTAPIAGSVWTVTDLTTLKKTHPWWTIVLAILLFPIGLLFLLITKEKLSGQLVEVSVASGTLFHAAQVPARDPGAIVRIRQQVNQAKTLAAAAND